MRHGFWWSEITNFEGAIHGFCRTYSSRILEAVRGCCGFVEGNFENWFAGVLLPGGCWLLLVVVRKAARRFSC
jgi:hypothetical protein